jgi:hypothetical protein
MALNLGAFYKNEEHGKGHAQLVTEIREVVAETRKRVINHNDIEDQQWREAYLRDARGSLN